MNSLESLISNEKYEEYTEMYDEDHSWTIALELFFTLAYWSQIRALRNRAQQKRRRLNHVSRNT